MFQIVLSKHSSMKSFPAFWSCVNWSESKKPDEAGGGGAPSTPTGWAPTPLTGEAPTTPCFCCNLHVNANNLAFTV